MVSVTIDNSYSKISGLNVSQDKSLRSLLSYTVGGSNAYFSKYGPRRSSLLSKRGEFPTGLLGRVYKFLVGCKIEVDVKDIRNKPPTPYEILPKLKVSLYKWQIEATKAADMNHRGIISAATGTGKSLAMINIIAYLGLKTLIVVPTLEIKRQLTETIDKLLGWPGLVTVENIDSSALEEKKDYQMLIIDEAHHSAAKTYRKLNKTVWKDIYYRYFFTATPFRNDDEEQILFECIAGHVIYELGYQEAVEEGYIVPVEAFYVDVPKQDTDAFTYREVYDQLVVHNEKRNYLASRLIDLLSYNGLSTLCLVREVEHGHRLSRNTIGPYDKQVPFTHGEESGSRKFIQQFNNGEINALIGTTGVLGEGVDTKPAEYVIIAGLGKAKSQFLQQVGRGVRKFEGKKSCKVIIFRDASHKYLLRHFNAQKKILLDYYGVKPVKLDVEV